MAGTRFWSKVERRSVGNSRNSAVQTRATRLLNGFDYFRACRRGVRRLDWPTGMIADGQQSSESLTEAIAFDDRTGLVFVVNQLALESDG